MEFVEYLNPEFALEEKLGWKQNQHAQQDSLEVSSTMNVFINIAEYWSQNTINGSFPCKTAHHSCLQLRLPYYILSSFLP